MPESQMRSAAFVLAGLAVVLGVLASSYDLISAIRSYLAPGTFSNISLTAPQKSNKKIIDMSDHIIKTPVYFLSHGGPNLMEEKNHPAYSKLQDIGKEITRNVKPKAVIIFSAHWQGDKDRVLVNTAEITDLIYDFYGFPDWYYSVKYPHVGSRDLAQHVMSELESAGIACAPVERGLDHGAWLPLLVAFDPEENPLHVPIVQVSLFKNEDPDEHYRLGQAVAALREENILILASGMAVHNLRDLWNSFGQDQPMPYVNSFDEALKEATTSEPDVRKVKMVQLLKRGDARQAHPTFDHLLPIHIAAGAAGTDSGTRLFTMADGSMSWAQYRFGKAAVNETPAARL